jgi:hypothetical protein
MLFADQAVGLSPPHPGWIPAGSPAVLSAALTG